MLLRCLTLSLFFKFKQKNQRPRKDQENLEWGACSNSTYNISFDWLRVCKKINSYHCHQCIPSSRNWCFYVVLQQVSYATFVCFQFEFFLCFVLWKEKKIKRWWQYKNQPSLVYLPILLSVRFTLYLYFHFVFIRFRFIFFVFSIEFVMWLMFAERENGWVVDIVGVVYWW